MDSRVNTAPVSRFDRFMNWAQQVHLGNKLAVGLAVAALLSVGATYFLLTGASFEVSGDGVTALLLFDLGLLLSIAALVAQRLARLWAARRSGLVGSGLHVRLVGIFSIVAIMPTLVVAISSTLFFERGIENWFDERVKRVLDSSLSVAEAYTNEHRRVIEADILNIANDLNRQAPTFSRNLQRLEQALTQHARLRSLSEAIVFRSSGQVLAKANMTFSLGIDRLPKSQIQQAAEGEVVIVPSETDDELRALIRLDSYFDTFLYISRFIDPRVLGHVQNARETVENYRKVEDELTHIQTIFNGVFIVMALLVLLAAVWMGLWLATRLVMPLTNLVVAADRVAQGDFSVHVSEGRENDEISRLSRAFNRMTDRLKSQHGELLEANRQLDSRRRFTETVLSGVSAGVIGLDPDGRIDLPNRSAAQLLSERPGSLVGRKIEDAVPEMAALVDEARRRPHKVAQDRLKILRKGRAYTFLVRVSAETEGDEIKGFVVTFDDMTKLEAAQRTAAWADVARRIAHEIKNPLTPIQLSAERLRRKYMKNIDDDTEVFSQCTDTIVRHVGDIRRMIDEFSAFARMPAPTFEHENLTELARQAVFSQEVATPEIAFSLESEPDKIIAQCDGRQMAQVFANLLKNATESILAKYDFEPAKAKKNKDRIAVSLADNGERIDIRIADSGRGLPELPPEQLIEPYVTTREKGTGLGLAIVEKVVKDHQGEFSLEEGEKRGAVARITLYHSRLGDRESGSEQTDSTETGVK